MSNADDVLLGNDSSPVVKFPVDSPGTVAKGIVRNKQVRQARDINGTPKTFDDGSPMNDVVITIQTDDRDPSIEDDDGTRRLIAGYEMQRAIGQAMRDAGVKSLDEGGMLAVQHTHNEPPTKNGFSPRKKFRAQFQPPAAGGAANDLLAGAAGSSATAPDQQPAPVQPPQQSQSTPAAQPAGSLL